MPLAQNDMGIIKSYNTPTSRIMINACVWCARRYFIVYIPIFVKNMAPERKRMSLSHHQNILNSILRYYEIISCVLNIEIPY